MQKNDMAERAEHFQPSQGALSVIRILRENGSEAYLVGGCVRDTLLGFIPKDEDIATDLAPEKVTELFRQKGMKVIPTGIKHGTVTVLAGTETGTEGYEVTTYRIDGTSSDHRHPDSVAFTKSLKEDLARRDFTMNAMALDPFAEDDSRRIIDYFGGLDDIKNNRIRTVGDPGDRIMEDALRMMRAVRFASQKDMEIDHSLKEAVKEHASEIQKVSCERINAELVKILESPCPAEGISNLHELGILEYIIPELEKAYRTKQNNPWHLYNVGKHTEAVLDSTPPDRILRLAALFHDIGKPEARTTDDKGTDHFYRHQEISRDITEKVMKRLRFTKEEIKNTCLLVAAHDDRLEPDRKNICRFIEKHQDMPVPLMRKLILLQKADHMGQNPEMTGDVGTACRMTQEIFNEITAGPCTKDDLAMNGKDIQGIQSDCRNDTVILYGKDIGVAKEKMFHIVLRNPEKNTREFLERWLKENLKQIKDISISRMQDGAEKDKMRMAFRNRSVLNRINRDIRENRGVMSPGYLREKRLSLMKQLKRVHSAQTPHLTVAELAELENQA